MLSAAGVRRELLHAAGQAGVLVTAGTGDRGPGGSGAGGLAERSLLTFSLDGRTVIAHRLVTQVVREGLARRGG